MTEYAPDAIRRLFDAIHEAIPAANNAGIVGDKAHTYGYHRGRNYVSSGDYSVQYAEDKRGDGEAACALDITWDKAQPQYDVSRRLMNAKNDPRMNAARSFFGSMDGVNVCGYDYRGNYETTSDDSHLWHIHLSILRENATQWEKLKPIAEVITGQAQEDDMNKEDTMALISAAMQSYHYGGSHGSWNDADYAWINGPNEGVGDRLSKVEDEKIVRAVVEQFAWAYHFGGEHKQGWTHENYPSLIGDAGHGVDDRLKRLEQ